MRRQEDAQHAALPLVQNGRSVCDRRLASVLCDEPDRTDLLGDQHASLRQEGDAPRQIEGCDLSHRERQAGLWLLSARVPRGVSAGCGGGQKQRCSEQPRHKLRFSCFEVTRSGKSALARLCSRRSGLIIGQRLVWTDKRLVWTRRWLEWRRDTGRLAP